MLFGGSFDPVHHGHLRAALETAEALNLPQVDLLPAARPALRDALAASAEHRAAMLRLAIAAESQLGLDDRELRRSGDSYTHETLSEVRAEIGGQRPLLFLLGADAFSRLTQWRHWQDLLRLAHLLILNRPGQALSPPEDAAFLAARVKDPKQLLDAPSGTWSCLSMTPLAISATDLRRRRREGLSLRYLVPDAVVAYIEEHELYR